MKTNPDYRKNHIQKWKQSGLSMQRYCREQEISYWSFRDWKKNIVFENSPDEGGLVKIPDTLYRKQKNYEPIEILLNNGIRIIVKENSGIDNLKDIVCTLAGLS